MAKPKGWRGEPGRHALAAKGIKTSLKLSASGRTERALKRLQEQARTMGGGDSIENFTSVGTEDDIEYLDKIYDEAHGFLWADVPVKEVSIARMQSDQNTISFEQVEKAIKNFSSIPPGQIVDLGGVLWINNGNHRVAAARLLGEKSIKMRVLKL